jgi:hypothetical protein
MLLFSLLVIVLGGLALRRNDWIPSRFLLRAPFAVSE